MSTTTAAAPVVRMPMRLFTGMPQLLRRKAGDGLRRVKSISFSLKGQNARCGSGTGIGPIAVARPGAGRAGARRRRGASSPRGRGSGARGPLLAQVVAVQLHERVHRHGHVDHDVGLHALQGRRQPLLLVAVGHLVDEVGEGVLAGQGRRRVGEDDRLRRGGGSRHRHYRGHRLRSALGTRRLAQAVAAEDDQQQDGDGPADQPPLVAVAGGTRSRYCCSGFGRGAGRCWGCSVVSVSVSG